MKLIYRRNRNKQANDKKSLTGFVDKVPVVGMKTRDGSKVIVNVEQNTGKNTLMKNVYNHVEMNSLIITDELPAYKQIKEGGYWIHRKINHSKENMQKKIQ